MINNDLDPIEDLEMLKTAKNEWKICSVEKPRKYQLKVEQSMCNLKQLYDEHWQASKEILHEQLTLSVPCDFSVRDH